MTELYYCYSSGVRRVSTIRAIREKEDLMNEVFALKRPRDLVTVPEGSFQILKFGLLTV